LRTGNLLPVVRWFRKRGHEIFSDEVACLYLNELAQRLDRGEIKQGYYHYLRRGVTRMMEVFGCGAPRWSLPKRGSNYQFNNYYEKLLVEFK